MLPTGVAITMFRPEKGRELRALGKGVYTSWHASRLAGLPRRSLNYWKQTGLIVPHIEKGEPGTPALYTYADLRELAVIRQLRRQGLSMPRVRRAIEYLQPLVRGRSWAEQFRLVTEGTHAWTLVPAPDGMTDLLAVDYSGHKAVAAFVGDIVQQFEHDPDLAHLRDFAPWIAIRPDVLAGAPVVRDTRIATGLIYALRTNGWTERMVLDAYPGLGPTAMEKALGFEETIGVPQAA